MLILGIDDAGRGPVIGPMVLAGVLIKKETEREFIELGVRDSKTLLPNKREALAKIIKEKAISWFHVIISVNEIDDVNKDGMNLNDREAVASAMIINKLNKKKENIKVIIDCPSVNIEAWKNYLEKFLVGRANLEISCEHKADENNVVVGAASILAKTIRDAEIEKIKKSLGVDFGSGYTADPLTRKFIYTSYDKYKDKGIFRESWSTIKKHKLIRKQKKLF
ncbi:ribonuclease HII [Candidatus Pacearchaeota archaeon]|nr:ribonuclease HII [Candidatus Pacearchaeota archaeon]